MAYDIETLDIEGKDARARAEFVKEFRKYNFPIVPEKSFEPEEPVQPLGGDVFGTKGSYMTSINGQIAGIYVQIKKIKDANNME